MSCMPCSRQSSLVLLLSCMLTLCFSHVHSLHSCGQKMSATSLPNRACASVVAEVISSALCCSTGMPPSWARKEGTREAVQQIQQATQQGDMSIALYRWKFLSFPADSHRPPYHGSFQKLRHALLCCEI